MNDIIKYKIQSLMKDSLLDGVLIENKITDFIMNIYDPKI